MIIRRRVPPESSPRPRHGREPDDKRGEDLGGEARNGHIPRSAGTVDAHYTSPAGATRSEVDQAAWRDVVAHCPPLADMAPEVEALLVNIARGRSDHWLVPIDDCFALVTLVRREWRGLSGGTRVWPMIDQFFAALTEQRR
jgi:hypothetical protein